MSDPNYNPETDTYRQIYRGHENASAVTGGAGTVRVAAFPLA